MKDKTRLSRQQKTVSSAVLKSKIRQSKVDARICLIHSRELYKVEESDNLEYGDKKLRSKTFAKYGGRIEILAGYHRKLCR